MTDARSHALSFEAIKISVRQTKDGFAMVLSIHPDDMPEELFKSPIGARYQVAMVLIGDDGRPTSMVKPLPGRPMDDRVRYAVMLCKEPLFQAWLRRLGYEQATDEPGAADALYAALGIDSRTELKTNTPAQEDFDRMAADYRRDTGIE